MNDSEHEQAIDEFEAKITPLDQSDTAISPLSSPRFPKSRFSPLQRTLALRLSVVLSFMLLALLVFSDSFQLLRNATFGALGGLIPAPTPTLFGGEDSFYMDVSIPWTKVFLDGHLIRLPRNNDTPLKLARGRHLIEWSAEPFQTQSCIMSCHSLSTAPAHLLLMNLGN